MVMNELFDSVPTQFFFCPRGRVKALIIYNTVGPLPDAVFS